MVREGGVVAWFALRSKRCKWDREQLEGHGVLTACVRSVRTLDGQRAIRPKQSTLVLAASTFMSPQQSPH